MLVVNTRNLSDKCNSFSYRCLLRVDYYYCYDYYSCKLSVFSISHYHLIMGLVLYPQSEYSLFNI